MDEERYYVALENLIDHVKCDIEYTPDKATRDYKVMKDLIKKSSYYLNKKNILELYKMLRSR